MSERLRIASHKGPYEVLFVDDAGPSLADDAREGTHFLVDARVAELHADALAPVLAHPSTLRIEAIEPAKSLDRFPAYVEHLVARGVRRDHALVAVGGGIVQDIACFLAATLLRGLAWRFYPTTLLAQADSCIGSKSSINCGQAKNILGTFTPPDRVVVSSGFLATLDEREVRSGVGEMIKAHAIDGPESFRRIAADYARLFAESAVMAETIRRSLAIKQRYIEADEFDRGVRNVFNYGHSFGHAIEAATAFAIPHGIAVTIGMDMANFMAARLGVATDAPYQSMHAILRANYRGYEDHPVPVEPVLEALAKDKKNAGTGTVTLILPDREGRLGKATHAADAAFAAHVEEYLRTGRRA